MAGIVDQIIRYLLCLGCSFVVRGAKPGKNVQLQENEIRGLCLKSREIFLSQPILLELEAPLKICGQLACQSTRITKTVATVCSYTFYIVCVSELAPASYYGTYKTL